MIKLALQKIKAKKISSIIFLIAFISIFTLIPLGLSYSKESAVKVQENIENHGRGSYDILVRPGGSRTNTEKELDIVEENYIGDGNGGISLQEWEDIKKDNRIEVAAPIASVGYFTGKRSSITLPILEHPTMFSWSFSTTDGQENYPLTKEDQLIFFKELMPGQIQYLKRINIENGTTAGAPSMEIMLPSSYHLLAAIDIESEQKLTGVDFSELENDIEPPVLDSIKMTFGDIPIVKVIQRSDINIPLKLNLAVNKLDIDYAEYQKKLGISGNDWTMAGEPNKVEEVISEISKLKNPASKKYEFDLSAYQNPFDGASLQLKEDFSFGEPTSFFADRSNSSVYYTAEKINYDIDGKNIKVHKVDDSIPPAYKELNKKGKNLHISTDVPYILEQVGAFNPLKSNTNELTASPLGIYGLEETITKDGDSLNPTTVPGSFIGQPAGALISIDSAPMLKGDYPIDAIRVRVADIEKYNHSAQKKIEDVAADLLEKGFEVDIVAGSSYKETEIEVEGIGDIIQSWTTLGVAQELQKSWNVKSLVTTILFFVFGIVWIINRMIFESNNRIEENDLLKKIGWSKNNIFLKNLIEVLFFIVFGLLLSVFILMLIGVNIYSFILTLILFLFSIIVTMISMKSSKVIKKDRAKSHKKLQAFFYYFSLIFPTMLVLIISTVIIGIQVSSFIELLVLNDLTSMGKYSLSITSTINIIILLSTIFLSAFAAFECISTLLSIRQNEFRMYNMIGWDEKKIVYYFTKEITTWAFLSIAVGTLMSLLTLLIIGISIKWILIGLSVTSLIFMLFIFTLCKIYLKKLVKSAY
ncbi:hypothetical protein ABFV99_21340 [Cytobacillus horneckiae]|uniref:ABC transporter permease n=1 Tax=Cytobacillus horneckiae TaxID=549687 RepID=UPI0034CFA8D8